MRLLRPLLLAGLLGTAFAVPAFAQPASSSQYPPFPCKQPTDAQQTDAHTLYTAGKKRFDVAEYDKALALFNEAYAADCTKHELLIIIARAYELKGARAEAIVALETYVRRVPNAPDLETHRQRIENMKREIAAQQASATAANTAVAPTATANPTTTATNPPPPPPPPEENGHTALPWVLVGVGTAGLITGIVLYVIGNSNFPTGCDSSSGVCQNYYDDNTPVPSGTVQPVPPLPSVDKVPPNCGGSTGSTENNGCQDSSFNKKRQQDAATNNGVRNAGLGVAIGGGVLIAGGLVWHFLEPTGPKRSGALPESWHIIPVVTPNYGGLGFGGSF